MHLHRFYVPSDVHELDHNFWLRQPELFKQWTKVLRFRAGDQIVLFDGAVHDRLYEIIEIGTDAVHLNFVTDFDRKLPTRHVYLFWALLKKDKNDWVLQKAAELGVTNFVPILAERSEKTGFNLERAQKILIEAAEQCGRSDIPFVREPISLEEVIEEYKDKATLLICDEREEGSTMPGQDQPVGIFIGPEGGWSENEMTVFKAAKLGSLHLGHLTLRAETASVVAAAKLLGTSQ